MKLNAILAVVVYETKSSQYLIDVIYGGENKKPTVNINKVGLGRIN